jgi:uncharacterized protein YndB with AHSA1/START domain
MTRLRITRLLPAPIERVWAALTRPETLPEWFWPARLEPKATADPRPGGEYRIEGTGLAVSGRYLEADEPKRLVFTFRWDGEEAETVVTIDLASLGAQTELTLTHEGFDNEADRDNHITGWNDCLDRLAAYAP